MWPREDQVGIITDPEETAIIRAAYDECRVFTQSRNFGDFPEPLEGGLTHFDQLTTTKVASWLMRFSEIQRRRIGQLEEEFVGSETVQAASLCSGWIDMLDDGVVNAQNIRVVIPFKLEKSRELVKRNQE